MPNCTCLGKPESRFWEHSLTIAVAVLFAIAVLSAVSVPTHAQTYTDLHDFAASEMGQAIFPALLAQGRDGNLYGTASGGCGIVFKMTPTGTISVLHTFVGGASDGCLPSSGLTLGTDGDFYGTTSSGGPSNFGTVFKITPSGTITILHFFDGIGKYSDPVAPPVQGKNGSYYGVTAFGGAYSLTSAGKYKAINSFIGGGVEVPLLLANDGNFYGVALTGGANSKGMVFRLSASGSVKVVYDFDGTHGASPRGGLVQGADGLLYGSTEYGGAHNRGVIFKMTLKGSITVLHDTDLSTTEGAADVAGLIAASDGNFYGTPSTGGGGNPGVGTIYQITKSGTYATLYSFDTTHGAYPEATATQHTNGIIYGLTTAGGTNSKGVAYSFNNSLPRFVALMTTTGTAGQTLQILGTGLTGTTAVIFGSGPASFTVVSDSYMTATVPASGISDYVTVVTPSGTLTSNRQYKITPVISGFSPASGPVGSLVTITGSGFIGTKQVTFGGVKATSYTVDPSGTSITATVPVGSKTGKIAIKTAGGSASSKTVFTVT